MPMLLKPAACRRAVLQGIRAPPEAVWITDDILSRVLERLYVITRVPKRNATSVPGPMESRRRIGKRRIAHLSEAVQTPGQDFGSLWGIIGALDRQRWQWEAPSRRPPPPAASGKTNHLPAWLSEYEPIPVDEDLPEISSPEHTMLADEKRAFANIEGDLCTFGELLKASPTSRIQSLCDSFNQSFKQNIVLGLISEDVMSEGLRYITTTIREATVDRSLAASRCMSFYSATWDGIRGCKVLRPVDLGGDLLSRLLVLLGELPSTPVVQALITDIIQAASQDQLVQMEDGILTVVRIWLSSWTSVGIDCRRVSMDVKFSHPHHAVSDKPSLEVSMVALTKFLGQLRSTMAEKLLRASTDHFIRALANFKGPVSTVKALRYSWVSVVANIPSVSEALLMEIWSRMNFSREDPTDDGENYTQSIPHISLRESCNLLLDFWISHGQIKGAEAVKAKYMASLQKSGQSDNAGHLMQALNQCNEHWLKKADCLFRFLRCLGRPQVVYYAFRDMAAQNLLPASFAGRQFYEMSRIDPRCALNMYKLYDRVQHGKNRFVPDWCPNLIIAMIRSPDFAPAEIWNILRVPHLRPSQMSVSCKPLHPARIRLVHRMALEFAKAEGRTPRLALRNIMHCMLYLRRHGVPLSPDLSRALTEAGITRSLLDERWIGKRKASWILDIVRKVEGCGVSAEMEQILQTWLTERIAQQQRLEREANPLRVGVID